MKFESIPTLLSKRDAAKVMGIGLWTFNELIRTGQIKGVLVSKRLKFVEAELLGYLNRGVNEVPNDR